MENKILDLLNETSVLLNEGAQAEAYKKKKKQEKTDLENYYKEKNENRFSEKSTVGKKMTTSHPDYNQDDEYDEKTFYGIERDAKFNRAIINKKRKDLLKNVENKIYKDPYQVSLKNKDGSNFGKEEATYRFNKANDSIKKHFRRHPEKLFESVELATLLTEAAILLNEESITQSQLSVYNDKSYLIPDEDDDETRDERRAEGAKELAAKIAKENREKNK